MVSGPKFIFGSAYGAFFGSSTHHKFPQNAAFQIVLSAKDDIIVTAEDDETYIGRIVLLNH